MTPLDILQHRLVNQQVVATNFVVPDELVRWQVSMQAQDFSMALWAIGLRLPHLTYSDIEKAFNEGQILRTHIMRSTWHFIAPADIRCMLNLVAPRAHLTNQFSYRKYELDSATLNKSKDILVRYLSGGKNLTRLELMILMNREGLQVDRMRFMYIMMHAELEKLVCSGPRRGKNHTYTLLEERVPSVSLLNREEVLMRLAVQYFTSHGPATAKDFSWWSGLADTDSQAGIDMLDNRFERVVIDDLEYIFIPGTLPAYDRQKACFLMPDYDEYGISYRNRAFVFQQGYKHQLPYTHDLVVDGRIAGAWKVIEDKRQINIKIIACPLGDEHENIIAEAISRYKKFMEPEKARVYKYEPAFSGNFSYFS